MSIAAAQLHVNGCTLDFAGMTAGTRHARVRLPTYPFRHERWLWMHAYWGMVAVLLLLFANLLWVRGTDNRLRLRARAARARLGRGPDDSAFCLGVQWHPEWGAKANPVSASLFRRFGAAAKGNAS